MPPDIAMLTARVKGTVRVLGDFSTLREAEYSRSDYMQLLTSDLCACYGYNADLIELFLSLFSPAEAPGRNLTLTPTPTPTPTANPNPTPSPNLNPTPTP